MFLLERQESYPLSLLGKWWCFSKKHYCFWNSPLSGLLFPLYQIILTQVLILNPFVIWFSLLRVPVATTCMLCAWRGRKKLFDLHICKEVALSLSLRCGGRCKIVWPQLVQLLWQTGENIWLKLLPLKSPNVDYNLQERSFLIPVLNVSSDLSNCSLN